jgi:hypothetical protein
MFHARQPLILPESAILQPLIPESKAGLKRRTSQIDGVFKIKTKSFQGTKSKKRERERETETVSDF